MVYVFQALAQKACSDSKDPLNDSDASFDQSRDLSQSFYYSNQSHDASARSHDDSVLSHDVSTRSHDLSRRSHDSHNLSSKHSPRVRDAQRHSETEEDCVSFGPYSTHYDTLNTIGRGAFGFVKLAERKSDKQQVHISCKFCKIIGVFLLYAKL